MEKNRGIFWITGEALLAILGSWNAKGFLRPIMKGLPVDAEFESAYYDFSRHAFAVVVKHESLPKVCDGELIYSIGRLEFEFEEMPQPEPQPAREKRGYEFL